MQNWFNKRNGIRFHRSCPQNSRTFLRPLNCCLFSRFCLPIHKIQDFKSSLQMLAKHSHETMAEVVSNHMSAMKRSIASTSNSSGLQSVVHSRAFNGSIDPMNSSLSLQLTSGSQSRLRQPSCGLSFWIRILFCGPNCCASL